MNEIIFNEARAIQARDLERMTDNYGPCVVVTPFVCAVRGRALNTYHFNAEGADKQLGYTAQVWAYSGDEAAMVLEHLFSGNNEEIKAFDKCYDHDDGKPHVHWINVWNNARPVVIGDIDEAEDEDGNAICVYCGRSEDRPHVADCPDALAQDLSSGEIGPEDDSYSDALEAYELVYGRPFCESGNVTNKERAG